LPGASYFSTKEDAGRYFKCLYMQDVPIGDNDRTRSVPKIGRPTEENEERFIEWVSQYVISLNKDHPSVRDCIDIPPQRVHDTPITCPRSAMSLDDLAVDIAEAWMDENPDDGVPSMSKVAHLVASDGIEQKLDWFFDMLDDDRETPVVCVARYHDSLTAIADALDYHRVTYRRIDGSVPEATRAKYLKEWDAGEFQVWLGQATACAVSLNLQRANLQVHFEHEWQATLYDQISARTCRRGSQHDECHVWDLYANKMQLAILQRLRLGVTFDSSLAEWQAFNRAMPRRP
jgi:SNF2 family DNA or RNA helicase